MLKIRLLEHRADIEARLITNRELAKLLQVSAWSISVTIKRLGIQRQPAEYKAKQALVQARRAYRRKLANSLPPEQAATQARCSVRTIYRYRTT